MKLEQREIIFTGKLSTSVAIEKANMWLKKHVTGCVYSFRSQETGYIALEVKMVNAGYRIDVLDESLLRV